MIYFLVLLQKTYSKYTLERTACALLNIHIIGSAANKKHYFHFLRLAKKVLFSAKLFHFLSIQT